MNAEYRAHYERALARHQDRIQDRLVECVNQFGDRIDTPVTNDLLTELENDVCKTLEDYPIDDQTSALDLMVVKVKFDIETNHVEIDIDNIFHAYPPFGVRRSEPCAGSSSNS